MSVKIKKAFSLDEFVFTGLKALSHAKRKSVSSVLEEIVREKLEEEAKVNPFLKLEMADIAYADKEEQAEVEKWLKEMTPEELAPAGEMIVDTKTGEVIFKDL
jgi:hypothetical protein